MVDEKDRLGDKFHDVEKAREDQWAREQDQRLIEKMRLKQNAELHCPQCQEKLVAKAADGVAMMSCPSNHGAWLDKEALDKLAKSHR
jgi:ribosomal protein L37AE/L43A